MDPVAPSINFHPPNEAPPAGRRAQPCNIKKMALPLAFLAFCYTTLYFLGKSFQVSSFTATSAGLKTKVLRRVELKPGDAQPDLAVGRRQLVGTAGSEFQANSNSVPCNQAWSIPSVTAMNDGGFLVIWTSCPVSTSLSVINGQRFSYYSLPSGPELQLAPSGANQFAVVTALANDGFAATWFASDTSKIMGVQYFDNATAYGASFQTASTTATSMPVVAALPNNGFAISWFDSNIYVRPYLSSLAPSAPIQVNTNTLTTNSLPSIVNLLDGGVVITWFDYVGYTILARRYSSTFVAQGTQFQVNTNTLSNSVPFVGALTNGGFVISWTASGSGTTSIRARVYSAATVPGAEFQVSISNNIVSRSAVVGLKDGGFVVVWLAGSYAVYGRRYSSSFTATTGEFQVSTDNGLINLSRPRIAALNDGGFVVVWQGNGQGGTNYGVYGQRFDANGNMIGTIAYPTSQPSSQPTMLPSGQPSGQPSKRPSGQPSRKPSGQPSSQPSRKPSGQPSAHPSSQPSTQPSGQPSNQPSEQPSEQPSAIPSGAPTGQPTTGPSGLPSSSPTDQPSNAPSNIPSGLPSGQPSNNPSGNPSGAPTGQPTTGPSGFPSSSPTSQPSNAPSNIPSGLPSGQPSNTPSASPSGVPTGQPTTGPSGFPSSSPTGQPSNAPSNIPSGLPSGQPSNNPSVSPSGVPTGQPTTGPSGFPSSAPIGQPSNAPSNKPSGLPSGQPSNNPSVSPSGAPTGQPTTEPSGFPSSSPTGQPSNAPSSNAPSNIPSGLPSGQTSNNPSVSPSGASTGQPTTGPSGLPSSSPTGQPSNAPSSNPPSSTPSRFPSGQPSNHPSLSPLAFPSQRPSAGPTAQPSLVRSLSSPSSTNWTSVFAIDNVVALSVNLLSSLRDLYMLSGVQGAEYSFNGTQKALFTLPLGVISSFIAKNALFFLSEQNGATLLGELSLPNRMTHQLNEIYAAGCSFSAIRPSQGAQFLMALGDNCVLGMDRNFSSAALWKYGENAQTGCAIRDALSWNETHRLLAGSCNTQFLFSSPWEGTTGVAFLAFQDFQGNLSAASGLTLASSSYQTITCVATDLKSREEDRLTAFTGSSTQGVNTAFFGLAKGKNFNLLDTSFCSTTPLSSLKKTLIAEGRAFASGTLLNELTKQTFEFMVASLNASGSFAAFGLRGPKTEHVIDVDWVFTEGGIRVAALVANTAQRPMQEAIKSFFVETGLHFPGQAPLGYSWYPVAFKPCEVKQQFVAAPKEPSLSVSVALEPLMPSFVPTVQPSSFPSQDSDAPTFPPIPEGATSYPTLQPVSRRPTRAPVTSTPSFRPTASPSQGSSEKTAIPSFSKSKAPSRRPLQTTRQPSFVPPTSFPTLEPTPTPKIGYGKYSDILQTALIFIGLSSSVFGLYFFNKFLDLFKRSKKVRPAFKTAEAEKTLNFFSSSETKSAEAIAESRHFAFPARIDSESKQSSELFSLSSEEPSDESEPEESIESSLGTNWDLSGSDEESSHH